MEPLTIHEGTTVALDRTAVDTDAIIPGKFCLTVSRTGFADHLFHTWQADPYFPLNDPERQCATILIAGADFGTGSSREHAVWALQEWGFRVVISSRFGDIFYNNCSKTGLAAVRVSEAVSRRLLDRSSADVNFRVTVDLINLQVLWEESGRSQNAAIHMDTFTRRRFLEGLDDIDLTLTHLDRIREYEQRNAARFPTIIQGLRP